MDITLFDVLKLEEGYREKVYRCSEGYPTIGIGTKIGPKDAPLSNYTFKVSQRVAKVMLDDEVVDIIGRLNGTPWYHSLDESRQLIIQSMCYQMGVDGVLKFRKMIDALSRGHWDEAASQALDSLWARQTPKRANRHAEVLRSGDLNAVYEGLLL
ncbi:putative lysozyme [Vibrio phage vB_VchM-138]|uniref:putative lysozyme n=1 Tax=Vibrio phage vB_VchM-138 TaxID=1127518 RepID=UPI0002536E2D|nr:putative lysozyme [Vibrio phage vB_VchM-138]AFC22744.1 putative lysozyme [Vibrio phage vB_VchM-138]